MKLIGVSGAQGAGKSTLLKGLSQEQAGWHLDTFRVSRAVQAQLGWETLDKVMDSPDTMMQFQEEVFEQKLVRDSSIRRTDGDTVVITERTFADIEAYTHLWTFRFVKQDMMDLEDAMIFLTRFHQKCKAAQLECYDGVILVPLMDHVVWENDPNRAAKADAETVYEHIERFTERVEFLSQPKLRINTETVDDRIAQANLFLESFK